MSYETINVRTQDSVCFIEINRPAARNTINGKLLTECAQVLQACEQTASVVVLSGSAEYFCFGADFDAMAAAPGGAQNPGEGPAALYDLWLRMATGPYVMISLVRGRANAGGIGFVAASDIVLADETALFSLSELLFGVYPACVMPFLIRRIGFQKAHYLTLMTQPVAVQQAREWGLVDAFEASGDALLRRHLLRLRRLTPVAIRRYKTYVDSLGTPLRQQRDRAVAGNVEVFSDPANIEAITRYAKHGLFPWEKQ